MSNAQSFHQGVKSCTQVERRHLWAAGDPVRILGAGESQDPELQKEYLKLVGEKPTPLVPNEMEMRVKTTHRQTSSTQNLPPICIRSVVSLQLGRGSACACPAGATNVSPHRHGNVHVSPAAIDSADVDQRLSRRRRIA
jgi:hypothetical protein